MNAFCRYLATAAVTAALALGGTATAVAAAPAAPAQQSASAEGAEGARIMANGDFARGTTICKNMALTSGNGRTVLRLQEDGNLVVYRDGRPVWQAPNAWSRGNCAVFQNDGNFVLYDAGGNPVWASGTWRQGQTLSVQDDGNVVIYDARGRAVWHTNTAS
ncbi:MULTISPECIES: hypothetical protein [Streptomyces]|uniref:Bulb-type lectin domain-containing protein n=1 Tax=Streptomyces lycii TaxID=2654337 RepID=A0ABQ7FGU2_9ACTN|nr:hypothetical protein [Streptomyces lycii]KAF4406879.1 hypothetical protein GCU69_22770 [Streptomyces lycii]